MCDDFSKFGFETRQYFVNFGVAAQGLFGKNEVVIYRDLKHTAAAGDQRNPFDVWLEFV